MNDFIQRLFRRLSPDHEIDPQTAARIRWASFWLSCLAFLCVVQAVTGLLLATVYNPSTATAWASVWHVQTQVPAGWFIRGLHAIAAEWMIALLAVAAAHLLVIRAYCGSLTVSWWVLLVAFGLVLAEAFTGYLLPWDQRGYWGTFVRSNILARAPFVGPWLKSFLWGGPEMGNLTLSRFYALHSMALPALILALLLFVRGRHRPFDSPPVSHLARSLIRAALLVVVAGAAWRLHAFDGDSLGAPADPSSLDYPARPEWHTLFLFEWLKRFQGPTAEVIGAIMIPLVIVAFLFLLPFTEQFKKRAIARGVVLSFAVVLAVGMVGLTALALQADYKPDGRVLPDLLEKYRQGQPLSAEDQHVLRAADFHKKRDWSRLQARAAFNLAEKKGIPPDGPLTLLADYPWTRGPVLFAAHCASCHRQRGHDGRGVVPLEPPNSSDLGGFARRQWIRSLLKDPMSDRYFGRMQTPEGQPAHTRMAKWLSDSREELRDETERKAFEEELDAAAAYLEFESYFPGRLRPAAKDDDQSPDFPTDLPTRFDRNLILKGRQVFASRCNECHSYAGSRTGVTHAPEMLGYGSVDWTMLMIAEPDHESRYRGIGREPSRMPRFIERLTEQDRKLIATWLHENR